MTKRLVFVKDVPSDVNVHRFQANATEKPLLAFVSWHMVDKNDKENVRKRQLAIDSSKKLHEMQKIATSKTRSWFVGNDVHQGALKVTVVDYSFACLCLMVRFRRWWCRNVHADGSALRHL